MAMTTLVLGASGGLGRNVVEAAARAGHKVRAFVGKDLGHSWPDNVRLIEGDASIESHVVRSFEGVDVAYFCINPRFSRWLTDFPRLLSTAIAGARGAGARLVFPANVWIYGPGRPDRLIDEICAPSPTSQRGHLRASMERALRESGCRACMVRLPEFYGPNVVTLTAQVFRAALRNRRTLWPGTLDVNVEFVFMPDAAEALLRVGSTDGVDGEVFHLSGIRTTPREFIAAVYESLGVRPRAIAVPTLALKLAGLANPTARAAADVAHLWTMPICLDGAKYASRFGPIPQTPYADGIARTLAWHRSVPNLALQG